MHCFRALDCFILNTQVSIFPRNCSSVTGLNQCVKTQREQWGQLCCCLLGADIFSVWLLLEKSLGQAGLGKLVFGLDDI
jgi:hypothetical protein